METNLDVDQGFKPEPHFVGVIVKEEPDDLRLDEATEPVLIEDIEPKPKRTRGKYKTKKNTKDQPAEEESPKIKKRQYNKRAVKKQPEDVVPGFSGDDWSNLPPVSMEDVIPQCRFCLRKLSSRSLNKVLRKHSSKAMAAFQIRISPNAAYPFACCNCLNLLDVFIDFKETVARAEYMLLNERSHFEVDGWDEPGLVEAIVQCKNAVKLHRKQVETTYKEHIKRWKEVQELTVEIKHDMRSSCERIEVVPSVHDMMDEQSEEKVQDTIVEEKTEEKLPDMTADEVENKAHTLTIEKREEKLESDDEDFMPDDDDDEDYQPNLTEEKEAEKPEKKPKKPRNPLLPKKPYTPRVRGVKAEKQELCPICGETVCAQSAEGHRNRHLGLKPYRCPAEGCDLTFYSQFNQRIHVKRMHGEKGVQVHECEICKMMIRGPIGALKYHQRRHNTSEKNYVCQVCGKGFTMRWYLTQHSIIHSGQFPHKCSYCGKKFNNKWSMKTHEKNIHEKRNMVNPMAYDQSMNLSNDHEITGSSIEF